MRDRSLPLFIALLLVGVLALAGRHAHGWGAPDALPPSAAPLPGDLPPGEGDPDAGLEGQLLFDPDTGISLGG